MRNYKTNYAGHNIVVSAGSSAADNLTGFIAGTTVAAGNPLGGLATLLGLKCHAHLSIDGETVDEKSMSGMSSGTMRLQGLPRYGTPILVTAIFELNQFSSNHCSIYADDGYGERLIFDK